MKCSINILMHVVKWSRIEVNKLFKLMLSLVGDYVSDVEIQI